MPLSAVRRRIRYLLFRYILPLKCLTLLFGIAVKKCISFMREASLSNAADAYFTASDHHASAPTALHRSAGNLSAWLQPPRLTVFFAALLHQAPALAPATSRRPRLVPRAEFDSVPSNQVMPP